MRHPEQDRRYHDGNGGPAQTFGLARNGTTDMRGQSYTGPDPKYASF